MQAVTIDSTISSEYLSFCATAQDSTLMVLAVHGSALSTALSTEFGSEETLGVAEVLAEASLLLLAC
jgi:hypothetical protein